MVISFKEVLLFVDNDQLENPQYEITEFNIKIPNLLKVNDSTMEYLCRSIGNAVGEEIKKNVTNVREKNKEITENKNDIFKK